jgi:hypothetical protein
MGRRIARRKKPISSCKFRFEWCLDISQILLHNEAWAIAVKRIVGIKMICIYLLL